MEKYLKRIAIMVTLIACGGILYWCYQQGGNYISLEALQQKATFLRLYTAEHYVRSLLVYSFVYMLFVILGIPASGPLTLLGGFLFGVFFTLISALCAIVVGISVSFAILRSFFIRMLRVKFARQQVQFAQCTQKYGITYLITLNLLMIVPFFVINALAALSNISLWSLLWTSVVGSTPMILVYACAGKKFSELTTISEVFSPSLILLFIMLILFSIVPMAIKRARYGSASNNSDL
jgi:uncharacterized membrane protein YdjX (TVP38/TMEM64 family)